MPQRSISNSQFQTANQVIQNRYVKIELLNYQYQTVDEISGIATSGSFTINATSDVRRTGSISFVVNDSTFEVNSGGKIWLDKYLRLFIGIENLFTGDITWTNYGMYIIDAPSYNYNPSTNTMTLTLLDLMAKLTGVRDGYLPGIPTVYKAGENIRQAIIDTLALGGFTKYVVEEAPSPGTIPVDLEFGQGASIYTLLSGLRDIYPDYEIFFDVEGIFYYKPIPTGEQDPIIADDTLFDNIVTEEQITTDFQNVKNSIEVFGRTHNPRHFSEETTVSGSTIQLNIASVKTYTEDMIYGFTLTDNPGYSNMNLQINALGSLPIQDDKGNNVNIKAENGEIYFCVQYKKTYWYWLGHLQAYGIAKDENAESPFNINSTIGEIHLPLYGGEYSNCLTDDLAQQRAEYELYLHTNLNDTITLSCVPVYWLDVNIKVEYTLKRNNKKLPYIIKTINVGLAPMDSMTITMARFYPQNPKMINRN